jgi:TRAP-type uncharacterized transport system substrate-binding protein
VEVLEKLSLTPGSFGGGASPVDAKLAKKLADEKKTLSEVEVTGAKVAEFKQLRSLQNELATMELIQGSSNPTEIITEEEAVDTLMYFEIINYL